MNGIHQLFPMAFGISMAISHVGMVFADVPAKTPIKHLVVVVGENVTFDTLYGVYKPPEGQNIKNLLSEGIVDANGSPGFNYAKALQRQPNVLANQYRITPSLGDAYAALAQPLEVGIFDVDSFRFKSATTDHRFPANLPNGPFQITRYVPYVY
jgi:phospholipase C